MVFDTQKDSNVRLILCREELSRREWNIRPSRMCSLILRFFFFVKFTRDLPRSLDLRLVVAVVSHARSLRFFHYSFFCEKKKNYAPSICRSTMTSIRFGTKNLTESHKCSKNTYSVISFPVRFDIFRCTRGNAIRLIKIQ